MKDRGVPFPTGKSPRHEVPHPHARFRRRRRTPVGRPAGRHRGDPLCSRCHAGYPSGTGSRPQRLRARAPAARRPGARLHLRGSGCLARRRRAARSPRLLGTRRRPHPGGGLPRATVRAGLPQRQAALPRLRRRLSTPDRHQERGPGHLGRDRGRASRALSVHYPLQERAGQGPRGRGRHQWEPPAGGHAGRRHPLLRLRRQVRGPWLRHGCGIHAADQRELDQAVHVARRGRDAGR
ncbi:hypothetical protein ACFFX0_14210 [Citricoccus parietis]|uniref:Uncharacterized protein n=1 Tax=Citricoccus parietis TaxID=592307 RepID=A0ABV5G023_9MICC